MRRVQDQAADSASRQYDGKVVTVNMNVELLQCGVCLGPLKPPIFECGRGHASCPECSRDGAPDYDCLMCRYSSATTRCHVMERVLDGLSVPCAFRQQGCTEMIPYAERQAHEASCDYLLSHCPIAGCGGYVGGGTLRNHILFGHPYPEVQRFQVMPGRTTTMLMRPGEKARVLGRGNGGKEFLLIVGRGEPSGRVLSMIHLVGQPPRADDQAEENSVYFKIEVLGNGSALTLSGRAEGVERLTKPYKPSTFLFVPDAVWEADPQDIVPVPVAGWEADHQDIFPVFVKLT